MIDLLPSLSVIVLCMALVAFAASRGVRPPHRGLLVAGAVLSVVGLALFVWWRVSGR